MIIEKLEKGRIIPVIALDSADDALPLCRALEAGGLMVAEITFRTPAARSALSLVASEFPGFVLGAGTVTTREEVDAAREAGAQFAVAPGLNPSIVRHARDAELPFFPGVCTPSEIEAALDLGCTTLKFFPAEALGGTKMLKALYAPYRHRGVRFIPTGGIDASNLRSYLSLAGVLAVGGSWLVESSLLKKKAWDEVTRLTREAVAAVKEIGARS